MSRRDPNDCAECARQHSPWYRGPCHHGDPVLRARTRRELAAADRAALVRDQLGAVIASAEALGPRTVELPRPGEFPMTRNGKELIVTLANGRRYRLTVAELP